MVNKVTLIGRLGKDPIGRSFDKNKQNTKFTLATNERFRDNSGKWLENTEWHDIIMWGEVAERAEKLLKKGNLIYIEGKLTSNSWIDKEGTTRYKTEVRANSFKILQGGNKVEEEKLNGVKTSTKSPLVVIPAEDNTDELPF